MAKVVCVLYQDRSTVPTSYPRHGIPPRHLSRRPDPAHPHDIDFVPGAARERVRRTGPAPLPGAAGHTLVVTADKDGADSVFDRELADATS